jgi:hypothetical protein
MQLKVRLIYKLAAFRLRTDERQTNVTRILTGEILSMDCRCHIGVLHGVLREKSASSPWLQKRLVPLKSAATQQASIFIKQFCCRYTDVPGFTFSHSACLPSFASSFNTTIQGSFQCVVTYKNINAWIVLCTLALDYDIAAYSAFYTRLSFKVERWTESILLRRGFEWADSGPHATHETICFGPHRVWAVG